MKNGCRTKEHRTKTPTALAEQELQRGTRLCSQSQRAALRATILFSPRKTVSFIQTKRCAMQTLQLMVMQHVELISAPCLPY